MTDIVRVPGWARSYVTVRGSVTDYLAHPTAQGPPRYLSVQADKPSMSARFYLQGRMIILAFDASLGVGGGSAWGMSAGQRGTAQIEAGLSRARREGWVP